MEGSTPNDERKDEVIIGDADIEQRRVENVVQSNNTTKITDVNQFCLEKICTYLDLVDLLNVANANKYLQLATHSPFTRLNTRKTIDIWLSYDCSDGEDENRFQYHISNAKITNDKTTIIIADFKTALQMLRCFGHMFVNISLLYRNECHNSQRLNRLMSYINEFCAESLTKIEMSTMFTHLPHQEFKKPFTNIESVILKDSSLGDCNMRIIFPKLRRLICSRNCNPRSITPVVLSSNLEHLEFSNFYAQHIDENKQTIADILRLNPQLRSLTIEFLEFDVLRFIAKYLQSVESLYILTKSSYHRGDLIRFSNVKCLTVHVSGVENMNFPLLVNQLKEFTIEGDCRWHDFIVFIKRHQSIEKITIKTMKLIRFAFKLMKALPTLQSINIIPEIGGEELTLDIIMGYLPIFRHLPSFNFRADNNYIISEDSIRKYCSEEWHVTCVKVGMFNYFTLRPIEETV